MGYFPEIYAYERQRVVNIKSDMSTAVRLLHIY